MNSDHRRHGPFSPAPSEPLGSSPGRFVADRDDRGTSPVSPAEQFGIPAESLRDWEQGRKAPDTAAKSYLRVIARMPEAVAKVLHDAA
ncbi:MULTISPECIES: helix-turn-helix domain-containing protein [unclassified Thiocapsa]|uniref:helix-turn-helix domain-containing protein n=1 Tax=unclassified Thiocapsa TaxID=2641286 RepID=UPI0035B15C7B